MKPLNQKERSKAWWRVAGLFTLCFALAMIVGCVTLNVNQLTETKDRGELQKLQNQLAFQREVFAPNVDEAGRNLAKVPVYREEGENIEVLHSNIASVLSQTMRQVDDDDSWESEMYKNILKVYSDLQTSYRDQLRMKDELDILRSGSQGNNRELQRCLEDKLALQSEINTLKLSAGTAASGNMAQLERRLEQTKKELDDCNQVNRILRTEIERLKNQ